MMFRALFIVAALAGFSEALRSRMHMRLQAEPDPTCSAWLATDVGQNFTNCENGNPGAPIASDANNCNVTATDLDEYCNDPCFDILTSGYDFIIQTGTCLAVYEDKFKPCVNNTDCPDLGAGSRICFEGFCYMACTTTDDCNSCMQETCETLGESQGCRSNMTQVAQAGLVNRTQQNTFRGVIYSIKASCIQNDQNNYCSLMPLTSNTTCEDLSQWGCCVGTIFPAMQYCQWENFTDSNMNALFQCDMKTPCQPLTTAQSYCQAVASNGTSNGTSSGTGSSGTGSSGSGSSGTSSKSSGMTGTSSKSSGMTGSTGGSGVGTGNGNAAGTITVSWAATLLLALIAHVVS